MITSQRYSSLKIELDDEDIRVFFQILELAQRYVKLKKRGDPRNWLASEVVLDEFTATECESIIEQLKQLKNI